MGSQDGESARAAGLTLPYAAVSSAASLSLARRVVSASRHVLWFVPAVSWLFYAWLRIFDPQIMKVDAVGLGWIYLSYACYAVAFASILTLPAVIMRPRSWTFWAAFALNLAWFI